MNECSLPVTGVGPLHTAVAAVVVILLGCGARWLSRRPRVPLVVIALVAASLAIVGFGRAASAASGCPGAITPTPTTPTTPNPTTPGSTPKHASTTSTTSTTTPASTTPGSTTPGSTTPGSTTPDTTTPDTTTPETTDPETTTTTSTPATTTPEETPPETTTPETTTPETTTPDTTTPETTTPETTAPETTTTIVETTTTTSTTLPNQAPVANDDFYSMFRTTASLSGNILANDSDPDPGDGIDGITSLSGNVTAWGTFTLTNWATGDFTYTLDTDNATIRNLGPGSFLDHEIIYRITDGESSDTAAITIRIVGVADDPV